MDINSPSQDFFEVPHSADIAIYVKGNTLQQLFSHASEGLFYIMGLETLLTPTIQKEIEITEGDKESLLVAFLSELIYEVENKVCFKIIDIQIGEKKLYAKLAGYPIVKQMREIKAATFHQLHIQYDSKTWHTPIIFDV